MSHRVGLRKRAELLVLALIERRSLRDRLRSMFALLLVGTLVQAGCAQDEQVARMRSALASPERPAEDKARDASRKPIETVQFLGIETGDTAIDLIAAAAGSPRCCRRPWAREARCTRRIRRSSCRRTRRKRCSRGSVTSRPCTVRSPRRALREQPTPPSLR
jgi:hypothetical protein